MSVNIDQILQQYDKAISKPWKKNPPDHPDIAKLREIAKKHFMADRNENRVAQLLTIIWDSELHLTKNKHSAAYNVLQSLWKQLLETIIRDDSSINFDLDLLNILKKEPLLVNAKEFSQSQEFTLFIAEIMLTLYEASNSKGTLFNRENYQKILDCILLYDLDFARDVEGFQGFGTISRDSNNINILRKLNLIFTYLIENNLLNQSNFDLILNNSADNSNGFYNSKLLNRVEHLSIIYELLTKHFLFTPNFVEKLTQVINSHPRGTGAFLTKIFMSTSKNEKDSFSAVCEYIISNHQKIPLEINTILSNIPTHLNTIQLLRQLIEITDRDITPQQKINTMTTLINGMIGNNNGQNFRNTPAAPAINYEQSVHNEFIEQTIINSVKKLKESYPDALTTEFEKNLRSLKEFANKLKNTGDERFAKAAIYSILNNIFDDSFKCEEITNKQALVLVWVALNDKAKYHPGVNLKTAKDRFISTMKGIERAYNTDQEGRDTGGESDPSCPGGTFNMTIDSLHTIHKDVTITYNSLQLAGYRLKAIITAEIEKYLKKFPDLDSSLKDKWITEIPELKSTIETVFKQDSDNTPFHSVLTCLTSLTINSVSAKQEPTPADTDSTNIPRINSDNNFFNRAWKKIKNSLQAALKNISLNPMTHVYYSDENEPYTSFHPLPHTRTLHTSFLKKISDTYIVLKGENILINSTYRMKLGVIDYLTFGIIRIPEILFLKYLASKKMSYQDLTPIPLFFFVIMRIAQEIAKHSIVGFLMVLSLPVITMVHLASKIAIAIETRRSMKIPTIDAGSSTSIIQNKFKNTSTFIAPHRPLDIEREIQFRTNNVDNYASTPFLLTSRKDIDNAHHIARIDRKACHQLNRAHMLSYRRVKSN